MITNVSMLFNGEYIENQIDGYTTLSVTGREMLSISESTSEVGNRDGVIYRNKRYNTRTLTINFAIECDSKTDALKALEDLSEILDVEQAEIIFNDESDLFYIGTRVGEPEVTAMNTSATTSSGHANAVATGSFTILCSDPFKYSVEEYEAEPEVVEDNNFSTFLVDYDGNHKSFPKYKVEFYSQGMIVDEDDNVSGEDDSDHGDRNEGLNGKGTCGYVSIYDDEKHILQFGNPDIEIPEEDLESENLVNQSFKNYGSYSNEIKAKWLSTPFVTPSNHFQNGSYDIAAAIYSASQTEIKSAILSKASGTKAKYTVNVLATSRKASSVKIKVTVKRKLTASTKAGKKAKLIAGLYVNGSWHDSTILKNKSSWSTKTATSTFSFTVSDISAITDVFSGIKFRVQRTGGTGTVGKLSSTSCKNIQVPTYGTIPANQYYLASSYGVHTKGSPSYYGPIIAREIPADSKGHAGASNFTLSWTSKFSIGKNATDIAQCGSAYAALLDSNRQILAGVEVTKIKSGSEANIIFYASGSKIHTIENISVSYKNGTENERACMISKSGLELNFSIFGKKHTHQLSQEAEAKYIIFGNFQYGTNPLLDWNGVCEVSFTKDMTENREDIPNPFHPGDVLEVDTSTGEVLLNGVRRPDLGALGNDWETMCLKPGLNQISTAFSDWAITDAFRNCFATETYSGDSYEEAVNEDGGNISEEEFNYDKTSYYIKSGSTYIRCTESSVYSSAVTYYTHTSASAQYYIKNGDDYVICSPQPSEEEYNSDPTNYYILEECSPKFSMTYREVYL